MICTDSWVCSTPALGGFTCAQLYYGVKSKCIALYSMTTESQGPDTLEDLCRDRLGAPIKTLGTTINVMKADHPVTIKKLVNQPIKAGKHR